MDATHEHDLTTDDGRDRGAVPVGVDDVGAPPLALLPEDESGGYRYRWQELQTRFVDDPRQTVEQADALVSEVMQRLDEVFLHERERLEEQWSRGEDVSTEDLRVALQRYRSFFRRLLST